MFKYACLNPIANVGLKNFTDEYQRTEDVNEAEGILVRSAKMHDMDLSDKLLAVARAGAGVNNIPLDKCADKGIVVFNTPGANANGVKELVIAGMLLAARDVVGGISWVQENKEDEEIAAKTEKAKKAYAGNEISGKKLGIIGLGAIGVRVANAAASLGMEVYGYDPYISVDSAWNLSQSIHHSKNVEEIYEECDYITIHVPLMDSTKKTINEEAIAMMKDGVVILNFARDLLVDEDAVIAALESGKVKHYVSDFPNTKVSKAKGAIVTPHLGASTEESEDNCAIMAVDEMRNYLENGNIINSVNYPRCDMGVCSQAGRIAIFHKNVENMISKVTKIIGDSGINITDMTNKSRGDYAYSLLDLGQPVSADVVKEIEAVDGVIRVRVVK